MIDFMVIAAPRSGTTWIANWLTTDTTLCLHDPLASYHYSELDDIKSSKKLGVSCTGLYLFPEWVNKHPAKKIIIHRDIEEVNKSLYSIGFPLLPLNTNEKLLDIEGIHTTLEAVLSSPKWIYEFLLEKPFDEERFLTLSKMKIEPMLDKILVNKDTFIRLTNELKGS